MNIYGQPVRESHAPGHIPADIGCILDYQRHAAHHLPAATWQHIQSGADQQLTLARNRAALDALSLLPRPLANSQGGHTRLALWGQTLAHPLLLAPVAYHKLVHPEGELASVRAAMALQAGYIASTLSSYTLEEIVTAAQVATHELGHSAPLWFQLYSQPTPEDTLALLRRAENAGYQALVWTVDAAIKQAGFALPHGVEAANLRDQSQPPNTQQSRIGGPLLLGTPLLAAAPTLHTLQWLRAQTRLPLIVKGVLCPETAAMAVAHGADALIISNHGGRVMDGVPAPIEVLPAIRTALPQTPLLLDSGIRWGTDAVKALALGADAVLIGRPILHALAVAGMQGVAHMLLLLRTELELAMAQLGCAQLEQLTTAVVWRG